MSFRLQLSTFGVGALTATMLLFGMQAPVRAADAPFSGLNGSWSGTGNITLSSGAVERIRCRASYSVGGGGNSLEQSLRCASDSYNFDLRSNVQAQGRAISGTWSETSRGVGGSLTGQASGNRLEVLVDSGGFSATLVLVTQGNRQNVSIRSPGSQFSGVSITLAKQ